MTARENNRAFLDKTIFMKPMDPRVTIMSNLDLYEYVDVDIEAESNVILFFSNTSSFADSIVFHLGWKTDEPETYKSWIKIYGNSGDETFYDKSKWFGVKNKLRYV